MEHVLNCYVLINVMSMLHITSLTTQLTSIIIAYMNSTLKLISSLSRCWQVADLTQKPNFFFIYLNIFLVPTWFKYCDSL